MACDFGRQYADKGLVEVAIGEQDHQVNVVPDEGKSVDPNTIAFGGAVDNLLDGIFIVALKK